AAVAEELPALLVGGADAVVDPLPDEPADQPPGLLEQLLVLGQSTGTGAERMPVLTQHEWQVAPVPVEPRIIQRLLLEGCDGRQLLMAGVHLRPQVDRTAALVTLVVHQP